MKNIILMSALLSVTTWAADTCNLTCSLSRPADPNTIIDRFSFDFTSMADLECKHAGFSFYHPLADHLVSVHLYYNEMNRIELSKKDDSKNAVAIDSSYGNVFLQGRNSFISLKTNEAQLSCRVD